ncbi:BMP family ABC transporter substrate-binding protein [Halobacteria archaeon AArc-dxtr1]|nr:BMP family ABC transporter substrate-binding protein [Halobacteria archaeon AArc-dxtr1]
MGGTHRCDQFTGRETGGETASRRSVLAAGAGLGCAITAGCLSSSDGSTLSVSIAVDPASPDDHLREAARDGLADAGDDRGFDPEIVTVDDAEDDGYRRTQEDLAADDPDLVVLVGDGHADSLGAVADDYPEQRWLLVSGTPVDRETVSSWIPARTEMAFLAGVAAGTLTTGSVEHGDSATDPDESTVGFVGASENDATLAIQESYVEGVAWANADVDVLTGYDDGFSWGYRETATEQYDDGADLVYADSEPGATQIVEAAAEHGRFAIATGPDGSAVDAVYEDAVVGTSTWTPAVATAEVASAIHDGDWERVTGEQFLDVETAALEFVTESEFEDALSEAIDAAADELASGDGDLSCTPRGC